MADKHRTEATDSEGNPIDEPVGVEGFEFQDGHAEGESIGVDRASIGPENREWGDRIDLFAVGGQSNAEGRGDSTTSPDVSKQAAIEYDAANDSLVEPLDDPVGNADTGSMWPAFCKRYYEMTGRKVCIVASAVGGSAQHKDADTGNGHWDDGTDSYRADLASDVTNAEAKLDSQGYDVNFRGILWLQGIKDANEIDNATITKSQYKTALEDMVTYFDGEFSEWSLWMWEELKHGTNDSAGWKDVRQAQREVTEANELVKMVSERQMRYMDGGLSVDSQHLNQAGLDKAGRHGAERLVFGLYDANEDAVGLAKRVHLGVNQTVSTSNLTTVLYDTTDTKAPMLGAYDSGTGQVTVERAGRYRIVARSTWDNTLPDGSASLFRLIKNGSTAVGGDADAIGAASQYFSMDLSREVDLAARDTIEVEIDKDNANNHDIFGTKAWTYLEIEFLGNS